MVEHEVCVRLFRSATPNNLPEQAEREEVQVVTEVVEE